MAPPMGPGSASEARSPRREGAAPSRPRLQVVRDGRRLRTCTNNHRFYTEERVVESRPHGGAWEGAGRKPAVMQ